MDRIAVFVDAGYLFAQGSTALTGSKKSRSSLVLNAPKVVEAFRSVAIEKAPKCELLRIYWYDGAIGGTRPTADQALLAHLDDVKLRLGFINSSGQQKGVDSLIVTDLIELAQLKSFTDAMLLSGDEDVRVGVQIAQNYGVRVHLIGIAPSRGSQSPQLLQEADTTSEWGKETIDTFLSIRQGEPNVQIGSAAVTSKQADSFGQLSQNNQEKIIENIVNDFVDALSGSDLVGIGAYWKTNRGVPADFDRKLLPSCQVAEMPLGAILIAKKSKSCARCFNRR